MEKVATEIGPELGNLVRVAFWTGWRRGELLNLKWADVDWEAGLLRLRPTSTIAGTTTKNNEGRVFPFRRLLPLEDALRAQRAYTDDVARRTGMIPQYVFHREGKQIGHFRRAWASASCGVGVRPKQQLHPALHTRGHSRSTMTLQPCRECGKQISTQAASCPHCGAPGPGGVSGAPRGAAPTALLRSFQSSVQIRVRDFTRIMVSRPGGFGACASAPPCHKPGARTTYRVRTACH